MKGDRKQYRVVYRVEWPAFPTVPPSKTRTTITRERRSRSLAGARKRLLRFGSEPWLAFGKGPDDGWCWGRPPCGDGQVGLSPDEIDEGCPHKHTTAREFFEHPDNSMAGTIVEIWLEERTVSPWSRIPAELGLSVTTEQPTNGELAIAHVATEQPEEPAA